MYSFKKNHNLTAKFLLLLIRHKDVWTFTRRNIFMAEIFSDKHLHFTRKSCDIVKFASIFHPSTGPSFIQAPYPSPSSSSIQPSMHLPSNSASSIHHPSSIHRPSSIHHCAPQRYFCWFPLNVVRVGCSRSQTSSEVCRSETELLGFWALNQLIEVQTDSVCPSELLENLSFYLQQLNCSVSVTSRSLLLSRQTQGSV